MWMWSAVSGTSSWLCTASVLLIFLLLEPVAVEHVEEVGVAAGVELVGAVDPHAAVGEQAGERAVGDRRADLGLDVVADDRTLRSEIASPTSDRTRRRPERS